MDRHAQVALISLPLRTTDLLCWVVRSRQEGGGGSKVSGSNHGYPQADGYNLGTMINQLENLGWKIALHSSMIWV